MHLETSEHPEPLETRSNHAQCRDLRLDGMQLNNEMNALYPQLRRAKHERDSIDQQLRTLNSELVDVTREISQLAKPTRLARRPGIVGVVTGGLQYMHLSNRKRTLESQMANLRTRRITAVRAVNAAQTQITRRERRQERIRQERRKLGCRD
ncbi:hypothetical protein [Pyruvatibacter sp.]|uniref:hypothetical protein n=1 Tax=Pyruvatibacter sp. TaxID=1981328 RepID=UPI003266B88E